MNHKARRKRYEGSGRGAQLNRIYVRDKGICQICFKPCDRVDASRDHIKDFSKCTLEEARRDSNVQLAHYWCNNQKHSLPKSVFRGLTYTLGSVSPVLESLYMEQRECHVITVSLHNETRATIARVAELVSDVVFASAENDPVISGHTKQEECDHLE